MPTYNDTRIFSLALNNMKLDEMLGVDGSDGSNNIKRLRESSVIHDKYFGLHFPYISINGYNVSRFLDNFFLDTSGFLPVVNFTFSPSETVFISVNYPKDGDIVSVYLRSPGEIYQPLRMDFKILSVLGDVSSKYSPNGIDSNGRYFKFNIVAECYIPGLYTARIKSFKSQNSSDCLLEVSQDLNLGFSTNERSTVDKMTWLCPNYSYYDFIQEVCNRAYKDDESSFFDCWIDLYYNLNFVNLGTQFSFDGICKEIVRIVPGYSSAGTQTDSAFPGTPTPDPINVPLIFNNSTGLGTIPFFINGYTLISYSGANSNAMGYITEIGFYDETSTEKNPSKKYVKYDIESQTPEDITTGLVLQKGRARDKKYKEEKRREWMGVLNSNPGQKEGVHVNYFQAKYQNLINLNDSNKMYLEIELDNYFPGVYKGQVVPVSIYVFDGMDMRQQNVGNLANRSSNNDLQPTKDEFLSGNYVIMGIQLNWNKYGGGIKQKLILGRRSWQLNSSGAIPKAFPISIKNRKF
jgi:hypothetical protein